MNQVYRIVWSSSLGMFQVVSELARAHGGKSTSTDRRRSGATSPLKAIATAAVLAAGSQGALAQLMVNGASATPSGYGYTWTDPNLQVTGLVGTSTAIGIQNSGSIGTLTNTGYLSGWDTALKNSSSGTITLIDNQSGISGALRGISNEGTIGTLYNESSGEIDGSSGYAVANSGVLGTLTNSGIIGKYAHFGVFNSGTLDTLTNNGTIHASNPTSLDAAIVNVGTLGTLYNGSASEISAGGGSVGGQAFGIDNGSTGNGLIGSLTNDGLIQATVMGTTGSIGVDSSTVYGINNESLGSIVSLTNQVIVSGVITGYGTSTGVVGANVAGIRNAGAIGTLTNVGLISAGLVGQSTILALSGSHAYGIDNAGSISTLNNTGTINAFATGTSLQAVVAAGLHNSGSIGALSNGGTIVGGNYGLFNDLGGTIGSIGNSVNGLIGGNTSGLRNSGAIGTLTNDGTIGRLGTLQLGVGTGLYNEGNIDVLANNGTISDASATAGLYNSGLVRSLTNSTGALISGATAIDNAASIRALSNSGTITGSLFAIYNENHGTISTISNAGVIAGNILNTSSQGLTIGGASSGFGTLTGFGNAIGTIISTASDLTFSGGNLVLNDDILMGTTNTVNNAAGVLQVNQPVTISGNYYQSADATLQIGVASGAVTQGTITDTGYGRLVVSGSSTIDAGSNVSLKSQGYAFAAGQRYVVVDTAGTAHYNQDTLNYSINGNSTLKVTGAVVANGSNSDLVLSVADAGSGSGSGSGDGSGSGTGDGSGSGSSGQDGGGSGSSGGSGGSSGSGSTPSSNADRATSPNAVAALRGLFGYTGIANAQLLNLYNASLGALSSGSSGDANHIGQQLAPIQVARAVAAPTFDALNVVSAHVNALRVAQADGATGLATGDSFSQVNLWGQAFGGHASQDARDDVDGYSANYGGLLIGADKALNDKWRIGGVFQYAHTAINNSDNTSGDSTGVNGYGLIGYASFTGSPWYVNMSGAAVLQRYDTERRVTMPGFEGVANGGFNGQQYVASVEGGWPLAVGSATLTPLASLTYSYLNQNSYTETGGNGAALHVDSSSASSVRSALGAKIEKAYDTSYGQIVPELRAAWVHEYNRTRQSTGASFAGDPTGATGFTTVGMTPVSNLADISLGLTLLRANNLSVTARYELQAGSGFISNTGILRLQQRF